jgi:glycosyltransferase involved in cell wall biosynthesis
VLASLADDGAVRALEVLNRTDVVIVQHEYGIYPGPDGESIVGLLDGIVGPVVVVAHTVVSTPTPNQRRVLEQVCARADVVVVMTETARTRLAAGFDVDESKVVVIAHGATTPPADTRPDAQQDPSPDGPRILTWGLLGPGKGIEWAIDAMDAVTDLRPRPHYVIAGTTHPKVRERSGESYREMLVDRAAASGASASISFDDTYRDLPSLMGLIRSADLVVLPYDSKEQVTSGVLVDAVAAGRPVIATAFPHAVELLASGAGLVVPQGDPVALGEAMRSVLTDRTLAASMAAEARRLAPDLAWSAVALRYIDLANDLIAPQRGGAGRLVTT